MTPQEAKRLALVFEAYALAGYPRHLFTAPLYLELRQCYGFSVAMQYTQDGFHTRRFKDPAARVETLYAMVERTLWHVKPFEVAAREIVWKHDLIAEAKKKLNPPFEMFSRGTKK